MEVSLLSMLQKEDSLVKSVNTIHDHIAIFAKEKHRVAASPYDCSAKEEDFLRYENLLTESYDELERACKELKAIRIEIAETIHQYGPRSIADDVF